MLGNWTPRDVIALVVIVLGFIMLACGYNGNVSVAVTAVIAFYYGMNRVEQKQATQRTL